MPNRYTGMRAIRNQRAKIVERIKNRDPELGAAIDDIRLDWYRIRNASDNPADPETTEVFIYDEIGGLCGISADEFVKDLQAITSPNIDVRINSPGGSLFDSIAIYNALVKHPANVTTYVDALAASGASIIAMAGDECVVMVGGQLMIHDALGLEMGNAADMRAMADFLDKQSGNIATIYAAKSGNDDVEMWRNLMLAETWMFAEEAVTLGLADSIYVRPTAKPEITEADDEDEEDTDDEESDDEEAITVENLMRIPHRLSNRGYRYRGRNAAPDPTSLVNTNSRPRRTIKPTDAQLDNFINAMSKTLGR
jgi:ATP-dependent protease ClpP protease subunit